MVLAMEAPEQIPGGIQIHPWITVDQREQLRVAEFQRRLNGYSEIIREALDEYFKKHK